MCSVNWSGIEGVHEQERPKYLGSSKVQKERRIILCTWFHCFDRDLASFPFPNTESIWWRIFCIEELLYFILKFISNLMLFHSSISNIFYFLLNWFKEGWEIKRKYEKKKEHLGSTIVNRCTRFLLLMFY